MGDVTQNPKARDGLRGDRLLPEHATSQTRDGLTWSKIEIALIATPYAAFYEDSPDEGDMRQGVKLAPCSTG